MSTFDGRLCDSVLADATVNVGQVVPDGRDSDVDALGRLVTRHCRQVEGHARVDAELRRHLVNVLL